MAKPTGTKLIAENRRARRDYELIERVEAGVVLTGTEVKSARDGHVEIGQAYARLSSGELTIILPKRLDRRGQVLTIPVETDSRPPV